MSTMFRESEAPCKAPVSKSLKRILAMVLFSTLTTSIGAQTLFIRGDALGDGNVDLSDLNLMQLYLLGDSSLLEYDAADCNDNGVVEISDLYYLTAYLFQNGPPLPPPGPAPGLDPTPLATFPPSTPSAGYHFSLEASTPEGAAGDLIVVTSSLSNADGVQGYQQRIVYDPTVFTLTTTAGSGPLSAVYSGSIGYSEDTVPPGSLRS